jgi:hypothetical protein
MQFTLIEYCPSKYTLSALLITDDSQDELLTAHADMPVSTQSTTDVSSPSASLLSSSQPTGLGCWAKTRDDVLSVIGWFSLHWLVFPVLYTLMNGVVFCDRFCGDGVYFPEAVSFIATIMRNPIKSFQTFFWFLKVFSCIRLFDVSGGIRQHFRRSVLVLGPLPEP